MLKTGLSGSLTILISFRHMSKSKEETYRMVLKTEGLDKQEDAFIKTSLSHDDSHIMLDMRSVVSVADEYDVTWQF